ncbi:MAG: CPBP family intramembrane metalloprotease [Aestuariibacter sp.]|nr:CPBP family intramembrane metalloprotease [Aestuariibacter sp.]
MKNHKLGFQVLGYFVLIFVLSLVVNAVFGVGPNWIMKRIGASQNVRVFIGNTFSYTGRLITIVLISAWFLKKVLSVDPWDTMFGKNNKRWWKELLFGILLSVAFMILIFIIENSIGWLEIKGWQWQSVPFIEYLRSVWLAILVNLTVAVSEEMIFRGYLLTGLEKAWGQTISLVIMALIFSAIHLGVLESNETNTLLFIILLTIPGLVFGWIYFRVKSLWIPIGIHFAWNFMQDEILNLHGRGSVNLIGAITKQTGPSWIVGTNYGIEVGLVGILAMGLVGLSVLLLFRKAQS